MPNERNASFVKESTCPAFGHHVAVPCAGMADLNCERFSAITTLTGSVSVEIGQIIDPI